MRLSCLTAMSSVKRKVASRAASSGLGSSATKKSKAAKKIVFLLSPAKSLDFDRSHPCLSSLPSSRTPNLLSETEELLHVMKKKKASELKTLFKVSDNLAKLNHERFQTFSKLPVKQAALAFDGQAYQGLRAYDFTEDELLWLDQHLCILSGFYGVIRPLVSSVASSLFIELSFFGKVFCLTSSACLCHIHMCVCVCVIFLRMRSERIGSRWVRS